MAKIGSFGPIVFEVSTDKIYTFDSFSRTTEPRYVEHKVQRLKPRLEFEGEGIDPIKLSIRLKSWLGVNPEKEMKRIRDYAQRGKRDLLIIGGNPVSPNYFVIKRAEETHSKVDDKGFVLEIDVQLELLEYVEEKIPDKKPTTSSIKKSAASNNNVNKPTGTMKISVKSVHIRSGPGANNKVLGYAMKGEELKVYGIEKGWFKLGGGKYITANDAYSSFKGASK